MEMYYKYWERHPPLHLLVAAFTGYKPKADEEVSDDEFMGSLMNMPGARRVDSPEDFARNR